MYKVCYDLYQQEHMKLPWLEKIKSTLDSLGLSNIWISQSFLNTKWLASAVKLKLHDQAKQEWTQSLSSSSKCTTYKLFKNEVVFEKYLDELPTSLAIIMAKFRCSSHRLPIEVGRFYNIPRHQRFCSKCTQNTVGDEFHFLFQCQFLKDLRQKYLPKRLYNHPNTLKLDELMNNKKYRMKLCKYIKEGIRLYT